MTLYPYDADIKKMQIIKRCRIYVNETLPLRRGYQQDADNKQKWNMPQ